MARNNGRDGIPRIGRPDGSTPSEDSLDSTLVGSSPVDIAAVRRDEEFIEAIRGDGPIATDDADEYQLALLLANWRAEIVHPALPAGPDLDEVAAAVDQEIAATGLRRKASSRGRQRLLRPVAGAAAAIALVMGGLVVFSYNSSPGDALWSVKSVVFSQQADSTVAQIDTTSKLEQAEQLIAAGDVEGAQALLDGASGAAGAVTDDAQRTDLEIWLQRLIEQLQTIIPTIPPQLPLPVDPTLPAPVQSAPELGSVPVTTDPLPPPVSGTIDPSQVPSTSDPVLPTTEPPAVTTTPPGPTILNQTGETTATASGSSDGTSAPRIDTLDTNGG
ncbi:hypothetical protein CH304_01650 [Rhodococcus sp. 15-649-1-2]|uniref:anti-sigma-D factor RsdA n=1 Tax=Nocardiaceae TaxID=85025 RepID=UPI00036A7421|nr:MULTISPECIES: anti-sigma-D factor RsdA [Rhodococcus]OZD07719.1 hypothetical protein CH280_25635 [Rhodococcus sp. 06-156-4C]OZD17068.1 hypothetical protein CH253_19655 [Rhodococcus sp. 06-156-3C]OZD18406.1 hypothetical protein CH248_16475 [Rhodococcus sp. 06-156-4a]OZD28393.1 hypothetical protein CH284_29190 [Rhodococcus sp. 06-156-3]OZD29838.1 hypothetical protein CH247_15660 [Rhodococcus sp. 06-156-3b]